MLIAVLAMCCGRWPFSTLLTFPGYGWYETEQRGRIISSRCRRCDWRRFCLQRAAEMSAQLFLKQLSFRFRFSARLSLSYTNRYFVGVNVKSISYQRHLWNNIAAFAIRASISKIFHAKY